MPKSADAPTNVFPNHNSPKIDPSNNQQLLNVIPDTPLIHTVPGCVHQPGAYGPHDGYGGLSCT